MGYLTDYYVAEHMNYDNGRKVIPLIRLVSPDGKSTIVLKMSSLQQRDALTSGKILSLEFDSAKGTVTSITQIR